MGRTKQVARLTTGGLMNNKKVEKTYKVPENAKGIHVVKSHFFLSLKQYVENILCLVVLFIVIELLLR
jgi:hypothetical protein